MKSALRILIPILWAACATAEPSVIHVRGQAEASVFPDRAVLVFQIASVGVDPLAAAGETARRYEAVAVRLEAFGFDRDRLVTKHFLVRERYAEDPQTRRRVRDGYEAVHDLRLETTDFARIGEIVDAVIGAGATRLSRIAFASSRIERTRDEALATAVARARRQAEIMAEAAGGRLGALIDMKSDRPSRDVADTAAGGGEARSVPTTIVPAELRTAMSVSATWEYLGDGD